jgi:hypothetical protein
MHASHHRLRHPPSWLVWGLLAIVLLLTFAVDLTGWLPD